MRLNAMHAALLVSLAAHGALLGWQLHAPTAAAKRSFEQAPLDVILVNGRSAEAPASAGAVAQANLAGGGSADSGRLSSPMPADRPQEIGESNESARLRSRQIAERRQQLLAQVRRDMALLPPPDPTHDDGSPDAADTRETRQQLMAILAEIERTTNLDNKRPRKRFVSADTREAVYALYYDALRRRIETQGTRHFPQTQGQKLYGELTMSLTVDAAGRVIEAEILQPSTTPALDQRALAIVRSAAPFGNFTPEMRREADQLIVSARFRFTRDDKLESTLGVPGQ